MRPHLLSVGILFVSSRSSSNPGLAHTDCIRQRVHRARDPTGGSRRPRDGRAENEPGVQPFFVSGCAARRTRGAAATPSLSMTCRRTCSSRFLPAVELLPPRQQAVVILHDVVGFTAAQVANCQRSWTASPRASTAPSTGAREPQPLTCGVAAAPYIWTQLEADECIDLRAAESFNERLLPRGKQQTSARRSAEAGRGDECACAEPATERPLSRVRSWRAYPDATCIGAVCHIALDVSLRSASNP